jgi:hypothetical protein
MRSPDETRQSLRPAPAGDNSERTAWVRKRGVGRRESRMAGEREVEPAAHAVTANRRYNWPARPLDFSHYALAEARKLNRLWWAQARNLGDFRAGGKGAISASNDCANEFLVPGDVGDFSAKLSKNLKLEAWESVIAIEGEKKNIFLP